MPILTRRTSWLLLSFAFFLILAPAFLSPEIGAQDTTMSIERVLPAAAQGGIGVIMLIVFLIQANKDKKRGEESLAFITAITVQLNRSDETTKLGFQKYNELTQQLIQLLKGSQEQNIQVLKDSQETTSLLTGTLSRLEVKLSHPVVCPIGEFQKMQKEIQG
jgi:hypothetical protein